MFLFIIISKWRDRHMTQVINEDLLVNGDFNASNTVYVVTSHPLSCKDYKIDIQGSGGQVFLSNASLKVNNQPVTIDSGSGINTVVLGFNGAYKAKKSHNICNSASEWNTWADWVNATATDFDVVAVATAAENSIRQVPKGGSAEKLLQTIKSIKAFDLGELGTSYCLLFIKGQTKSFEEKRTPKPIPVGKTGHGGGMLDGSQCTLSVTYYQLLEDYRKVGIGTENPEATLHVIGKEYVRTNQYDEAVVKVSRPSGDVSALFESGSGNEVYLRFKNKDTGDKSWMIGLDDDECFKIGYNIDGEIKEDIFLVEGVGAEVIGGQPQKIVVKETKTIFCISPKTGFVGIGKKPIEVLDSGQLQVAGKIKSDSIEARIISGSDIQAQSISGFYLNIDAETISAHKFITKNADCAEEFEISTSDNVEPGTLMVIDHDEKLQPSIEAYDKRVVGVVSGAGDLKPGLILNKKPDQSNRVPIALVGKVYCKVDAQYAPIEAGDLLTSSPTQGHAMKATDPAKAFGTVIGKALQPCSSGKGLVLILVSLH